MSQAEHVDEDLVALAALGEPVDPAVHDHIATCEHCSAELAQLRRAVTVGRAVTSADAPQAPPASVWSAITAELGLADSADPHGVAEVPAPAAEPVPAQPEPPVATVVPIGRRRPSRVWVAAAAAAGVVVGGAGGAWLVGRDTAPTPDLVAEAALDPLPGRDATGTAVVEETPDGERVLVLTMDETDDEGYREVWLIDRDVTRLVSLGVMNGSEGRFTVPEGLDLAEFPVVDVSDEPFDGDPSHSGESIVRGILDA